MESGSVADWVSGIGSLAAAISALYLAKSANKIRLEAHLDAYKTEGNKLFGIDRPQYYLSINVTNVGNRTTVVKKFKICVGLGKKKECFELPIDINQPSNAMVRPLADGEDEKWTIHLNRSIDPQKFIDTIILIDGFNRWTLRLEIYTSNGGVIKVRPNKDFLDQAKTGFRL